MEFHYKLKLKYSFMIFTLDISNPFLLYEFQTQILVKTYFLRYGLHLPVHVQHLYQHTFLPFILDFSKRNFALIILILYSVFWSCTITALKYPENAMSIM